MSRKRPTESGWESDEDDLLTVNDGGISAFRMQDDDDIDEAALLGLDDTGYDGTSGGGGHTDFGQESQQQDLLEIQVNPEEEEVLDYEDDIYSQEPEITIQDDGSSYVGTEADEALNESQDVSQTETQDFYQTKNQQQEPESDYSQAHEEEKDSSSYLKEEQEHGESESDSNSDGEEHGRLRFKSERANIISVSKGKSRTGIPETLEVSAEQQAKINEFTDLQQRQKGRGGQRTGFRGGRDRGGRGYHDDRRGRPMRGGRRGPLESSAPRFVPNRLGPIQPPMIRNNHPQPLMRIPHEHTVGPRFGPQIPGGPMPPQPLMALLPGQIPFRAPEPLQPRLQHLQEERLQRERQHQLQQQRRHLHQQQQQQQQQQFRPGPPVQVSGPPRPHKILINPNFRGPVPAGPPVSVQTSWADAPVSAALVPHHAGPAVHPKPLVIAGQPRPGQPFPQPQGSPFTSQGPRLAGPALIQPGTPRGVLQQAAPSRPVPAPLGFGASHQQGLRHHLPVGQDVMGSPPQAQPSLHQQQQVQFSPPFNNNRPQGAIQQRQPSPRILTPQQRFRAPTPGQQQLQRQPATRQFAVREQQRTPQRQQMVAIARKLTQQAKFTQQAKAASHNKNITVVPIVSLKRKSTDSSSGPSPTKASRASQPAQEVEPMDVELQEALRKQKQLREMIQKRKEANRRKQAAVRRRELEQKLAEQGLTIEDVEGNPEEDKDDSSMASGPPTLANTTQLEDQPMTMKRAQPIETLVSRGQQQQFHTAQQQQQSFQGRQQHPVQELQPQKPQQLNTSQSFQPRFPNQSGAVPPRQLGAQSNMQQQQQHPMSPRQQRPAITRQFSGQQPFQQQQRHQLHQQQRQQVQQPQQYQQQQQQQFHPQAQAPQQDQQHIHYQQPFQQQQQIMRSPQHIGQERRERFEQLQQAYQQEQEEEEQFQLQQSQIQQQHQFNHQQNQFQQRGQQQHVVGDSGDGFQAGTVQQTANRVVGSGRGILAMAGARIARGRSGIVQGAPVRGGIGRGMATSVATSPRQVMQPQQAGRTRTVLPARGGARGSMAGLKSAGNRVVMPQGQRQVMQGGVAKVQKSVTGPRMPQQVSIDNITATTSQAEIYSRCQEIGPVSNVIMIPSQKKALVTFRNKADALRFVQQNHRRMINLSMVSVSLLPEQQP